jgi:hypothetical protein
MIEQLSLQKVDYTEVGQGEFKAKNIYSLPCIQLLEAEVH